MKLLITGGAGFIGFNFLQYWAKQHPQDSIIVYDKLTYAAWKEDIVEFMLDNTKHSLFIGDICDEISLNEQVQKCDAIVHFAAESHVDNSIKNSSPFIQSNIVGTHTVLEVARKNNKRLHHISTDEVFGSLPLETTKEFTEETPYNPRSPYSASKASSDHLVRSYYHTYGCQVTISNCSNNYGPYQHIEKLLPKTIINLLNNKPVPIYGDGKNVRDWVYVIDHCKAIENILLNGRIGETYLVGGYKISNIDLIEKILNILEKPKSLLTFVPDRPGHDRKYAVNYEKITKELNWTPTTAFDLGLIQTINWYKNLPKT